MRLQAGRSLAITAGPFSSYELTSYYRTVMKAVVADPVGGPENLKYIDVPKPEPGAGEVLVKIQAIGVNFIDVYFRTGLYKASEQPVRIGSEAAGIVEAVGT